MEDIRKSIARRYIEEIVNTGDLDRVPEFIAHGYVDHNAPPGHISGIKGVQEHIRAVRNTYPDLVVAVADQIAEGDLVVTRIVAKATHQGEWLGMKPTNKPIVIQGVNIDRIIDGKIVEHWGMANTLEALLEIGAFPTEPFE